MVRYKRYRRYRRGSTGVIKMKFQSFMDISTSDSSMQIITVSAGGQDVIKRLAPQFSAYKYYKLGNVAVKLVPASTLPVDPTGLSYEAGENTVDPRDQLTPGMMRITNGEDIFEKLDGLSEDEQHALYNNMLLDPRWFKWMLQSGVKRHGSPRYWTVGQFHQDKWPDAIINVPEFDANGNIIGTRAVSQYYDDDDEELKSGVFGDSRHGTVHSSPQGLFQTGHSGRLGWLPTDGLRDVGLTPKAFLASVPEIEMYKIILPRAYKTKYYYRMFITETVYFRSPIVNFGINGAFGESYRPIDVFHYPSVPSPGLPTTSHPVTIGDSQTGGNDGGY